MNRLVTTLFWIFSGASIAAGIPASAADENAKIEVITVTALKRETNLLETPMATGLGESYDGLDRVLASQFAAR